VADIYKLPKPNTYNIPIKLVEKLSK